MKEINRVKHAIPLLFVICLIVNFYPIKVWTEEKDTASILLLGKTHSGETIYKGLSYHGETAENTDSIIDDLFDTTKSNNIKFTKGGSLKGKRDRKSIIKTIFNNISSLRYAYNKRLRVEPKLSGKVLVKFSIDETGNVVECEIAKTTLMDRPLQKIIVKKIKEWDFGKIVSPGDTTVIIYPFIFSR